MDKRLLVLCAVATLVMSVLSYPDGGLSVVMVVLIAAPVIFLIHRFAEEKIFLTNVFLIALLARIGLGVVIHTFELRNVFGPDSVLYDGVGLRLMDMWLGNPVPNDYLTYQALHPGSSGWGMFYLVAFIYLIFGHGILIAQSFCGAVGAITAPMIYLCTEQIFSNRRVSKTTAVLVALFPAFIVWSAQLLKDGLIIFLLVCAMTTVLKLQKKFSYFFVVVLIASVSGIIALRFYIFYMVAASIIGSFFIGAETSVKTIIRNIIIIVVLGLALTYLGVIRNASTNLEFYGNLERVQNSRMDLSRSASTGFGEDIDVSTTNGAISAVPIGLVYLFFAPFPWQVKKFSQVLVLPETFLWWALLPIMISGLWYSIKNKLRRALPILIFSLMLTLSYSIFQGNVGMIYRQRTQIQIFLFMFIAVGFTLFQERRENKRTLIEAKRRILKERYQPQQIES